MMNLVGPLMSTERANKTVCFMAIELSKMGWVVAMLTPLSNKISLRSIPCGAVEKLMEIVDQTINRVMQTTGELVQVVSCYEAGYDGFWLHRFLEARGIINHVLEAASLLVNRKARRAKTDRLAPKSLCEFLWHTAEGSQRSAA